MKTAAAASVGCSVATMAKDYFHQLFFWQTRIILTRQPVAWLKQLIMKSMFDGRLDDKQIEQLESMLEKHAIPNNGFTLERLDGYLLALVVSPERVMPSEWLPTVWGDKQPDWQSQQESFEANELLIMLWNRCVAFAQLGHKLPDDLFPLLRLPENPESNHPDSTIIGTFWALGFIQGSKLRLEAWLEWIKKEEWVAEFFSLMLELSSGENANDDKFDRASRHNSQCTTLNVDFIFS